MEYINESYDETEMLDLISFIVPTLTVKESKQDFKRKKTDNNIYFVDGDGVKYFQYNIVTNELGFISEIYDNFLKYMPDIFFIIFLKLISEWFNKKYDLPVNGKPFRIKKSFIA